MGEAKNRGTFEQRKAQAIAEGREKTRKITRTEEREIMSDLSKELFFPVMMEALAFVNFKMRPFK